MAYLRLLLVHLTFQLCYLSTHAQNDTTMSSTTMSSMNTTTMTPTSVPTIPTGLPTSVPSNSPSLAPSSSPTATKAPTHNPILDDGRDVSNDTQAPTFVSTLANNVPTPSPVCDNDGCLWNGTTLAPSESPSVAPSVVPSVAPSMAPTDNTSVIISPSTDANNNANNDGSYYDEFDDPIVVAVGLLGVLVLILTGLVSVFACMAYSKSKENVKITDRLRAQFMADNSHSKELNYDEINPNNNKKGRQYATDYRNVSTNGMLELEARDRNDTVPGSLSKNDLLAGDGDGGGDIVMIEMNSKNDNNSNSNSQNAAPQIVGESVANDTALSVTPGGGSDHVSTDEVIASVQNEGANANQRKPKLQLLSSQSSGTRSGNNDSGNGNVGGGGGGFLQGLSNVNAATDLQEDDIIAHMATDRGDGAAGGGNGAANGQNNDNSSFQLQFG